MRTFAGLCLMLCFASSAWAQAPNACGCYQDAQGACICARKSKCGCPDECEPVGCEAKRQRQADRDAEQELKRIAAREKKKAAEASREARERNRENQRAKRAQRDRNAKAKSGPPDPVEQLLRQK